MTQATWIYMIPDALMFIFLIGAIIFAAFQSRDGTRARTLVILGLATMLGLRIGNIAVNVTIARLGVNDFMLYHGLQSIVSTCIYMLAIGLLIAAAFCRGRVIDESLSDNPRSHVGSDNNPYSSPAS